MGIMRRQDRAVTDPAAIEDVIRRCTCCRVGFNDGGEVYIVPLNFGYERRGAAYTFYFHGAREGRKIGLARGGPRVGFEMDVQGGLNASDVACGWSARFESVIGGGVMAVVTDQTEKSHGLELIMEHNTGRGDWPFDETMLAGVEVLRLDVTELSCKEHK